ncbi:hypothetical protein LTEGF4_25450 (plasmid) [Limnohabitans sp. TEGF004]|nr:hypothetical protein LTEGF4_25450 [Limnohabitans sp. TEGF004]
MNQHRREGSFALNHAPKQKPLKFALVGSLGVGLISEFLKVSTNGLKVVAGLDKTKNTGSIAPIMSIQGVGEGGNAFDG